VEVSFLCLTRHQLCFAMCRLFQGMSHTKPQACTCVNAMGAAREGSRLADVDSTNDLSEPSVAALVDAGDAARSADDDVEDVSSKNEASVLSEAALRELSAQRLARRAAKRNLREAHRANSRAVHLAAAARRDPALEDAAAEAAAAALAAPLPEKWRKLMNNPLHAEALRQGLTLVHVRAQLEQLQHTFLSEIA